MVLGSRLQRLALRHLRQQANLGQGLRFCARHPTPNSSFEGQTDGYHVESANKRCSTACHTSSGFTLPNMPHQLHRRGSLPLSARRVSVAMRPGFNEWHNKRPRVQHTRHEPESRTSLTHQLRTPLISAGR